MTDRIDGQAGAGAGMAVLFAVREDWTDRPGGDTVQIRNTARELRRLGVEVTVSSDPKADLRGVDLMHVFHLGRVHESYPHVLNATAAGAAVVVSPIYWPTRRDGRAVTPDSGVGGFAEGVKNLMRSVRSSTPAARQGARLAARVGYARCCREIVEAASLLLPNSQAELELLRGHFGPGVRARVVPNGVDAAACREARREFSGERVDHVVCVGHFDPRKNQLGLIRALRDVDTPVVFVGEPREMHARYFRTCRRLARHGMQFLGAVSNEEVLALLARSHAYVCPSFIETPGLASLEAAAVGCNVALGDCAPVREYFGDEAIPFDPSDPSAIRRAVHEAVRRPLSPELRRRIRDQYDWSVAARETAEAYASVLGDRGSPTAQ